MHRKTTDSISEANLSKGQQQLLAFIRRNENERRARMRLMSLVLQYGKSTNGHAA